MGQDSWSDHEDDTNQRLVRVGIIGAPNAGKSVLTNTLVQSKVSIHTTSQTLNEPGSVTTRAADTD
jgi:GTPase Era involved in 16S rRNA processing